MYISNYWDSKLETAEAASPLLKWYFEGYISNRWLHLPKFLGKKTTNTIW